MKKIPKLLKEITTRYLDTVSFQGPRREYIITALRNYGLKPKEDGHGNIWVDTGSEGEYTLFSSHMDVEPNFKDILKIGMCKTENGPAYKGILDNSVGCYLNILATTYDSKKRAFHVFTASEEEDPENGDFAKSARDVIDVLEKKGARPDLCVALDLTYPALNITLEELNEIGKTDEAWNNATADYMFKRDDKTHCYLDGFDESVENGRRAADIARKLLSGFDDPNIQMRHFPGWDESAAYYKLSPSMAFGPVFFGKPDEPDQIMPIKNMKTAKRFMEHMKNIRQL